MKRTPRLLIVIIVIIFLISGTLLAIRFAKGYRPSITKKVFEGTGLLSANSIPKGATVFINDKLTTATDDTQNLPPGKYKIKIAKDGYIPWEKTLILEPELVNQTNARLFPSVPNLKPLTFTGALNPVTSPDGQKIIFAVESATTNDKNGLYVLDLLDRPFSLNSDPRQITRNSQNFDYSLAKLTWSPDSTQIIASFDEANLLLSAQSFNDLKDQKDITASLSLLIKEWNQKLDIKEHEKLLELPDFMQKIATASATAVYFSPNEDMLMYTATASATIPEELIPPLPASSTQKQTRNLEPDNIYIYDIEEDKNFLILKGQSLTGDPANGRVGTAKLEGLSFTDSELFNLQTLTNRYSPLNLQNIQWYPDSKHIIIVNQESIVIAEYDNTNHHTVYAGPFAKSFAYPWPNGNRLIVLASLNGGSNLTPNLYSINLK
ncbi:MAG: PEGA domain-containing protein [Patescibacteria group bacterium]|nr:PEGA domain-containing protein [Patescibacteria group bacterium]